MSRSKYSNLKDLIAYYTSGFGLSGKELYRRIQEAYEDNEISGHEYDDLVQYLDLEDE